MISRVSITFLATMLLVGFSQARGQSRWGEQVGDQLEMRGDFLASRGYSLVREIHQGSLADKASEDYWIDLDGAVEYALVGVCDEDCHDIDLAVYDDGDAEIDSDYELDDVPVVRVSPGTSNRYRVHVYLAGCESEPCFYGVGVYGRSSSTANEWEHQVNRQIATAGERYAERGYHPTHEPRSGALRDGEIDDFVVQLQAGRSYVILGVCDADCDDVDLAVYDAQDQEIDSDYLTDDYPVSSLQVMQTGQFRVQISMASCNTEPCYYGVGIFGKKGKS